MSSSSSSVISEMTEVLPEKPQSLASMWDSIRSLSIFQSSHNYLPLSLSSRLFSTRYRTVIKLGLAIAAITVFGLIIAHLEPVKTARDHGILRPHSKYAPIPRIVHYVYLQKDEQSTLEFRFSDFLSVFAAILYVNPSKVYFHSDYNTTSIAYAAQHGKRWTRKLLTSFPDILEWNPVIADNYAGPNQVDHIDAVQHKSDFVRWEQIGKTGGIYIDMDVLILRPLDPLLNAGFAFIAGRQYANQHEGGAINGTINNGALLSIPHSAMTTIVAKEQHAGFSGRWESNLVANTRVAEHLVSIPNECLILDRHAFAPTHWFGDSKEGTDNLFHQQPGSPAPEPLPVVKGDPVTMYESIVRNRRSRREWEFDWSSSYMVHAFATGGHQGDIHPKILLQRRSNYALAAWGALKEMLKRGLIDGKEDEHYGEED